MRVRWMQLAAQFFHEDPDRAAHVRNRGVYEAKHEGYIIAVSRWNAFLDQAPARIRGRTPRADPARWLQFF